MTQINVRSHHLLFLLWRYRKETKTETEGKKRAIKRESDLRMRRKRKQEVVTQIEPKRSISKRTNCLTYSNTHGLKSRTSSTEINSEVKEGQFFQVASKCLKMHCSIVLEELLKINDQRPL